MNRYVRTHLVLNHVRVQRRLALEQARYYGRQARETNCYDLYHEYQAVSRAFDLCQYYIKNIGRGVRHAAMLTPPKINELADEKYLSIL